MAILFFKKRERIAHLRKFLGVLINDLYVQGGEKYQQAFYVFEELAQAPHAPSTTASKSLISQAVAELHLGRLSEAEAALQETVKIEPRDAEALANSIVLQVIQGKDAEENEA